jgi:glycine betaine/proline transport system permease protein
MMAFSLHIGEGITIAVNYMLDNWEPFFDAVSAIINFLAQGFTTILNWLPIWGVFVIFIALALWRVGWGFALFVLVSLWVVTGMHLWPETMDTLALVIASAIYALAIGLTSGVFMAKSEWLATILRPILDFMQTLPPFVYLIPAAMFFGLGIVPGTIATVIFAMPPAVRLMNLGIRNVDVENVEAGRAFGCTPLQLLFKVELPLAMPSIKAGINQTIMLSLSMVVIASMIGAGGLGNTVLTGIETLNVGLGFEGGIGVVIIAIILDRLTQSIGVSKRERNTPLTQMVRFASFLLGKGKEEGEGSTTPAATGE